jgi:hypothetical protein
MNLIRLSLTKSTKTIKKKEAGEGGLDAVLGPSGKHGVDNCRRTAGTEGRTYDPCGKPGHVWAEGWHPYCSWLESEAE